MSQHKYKRFKSSSRLPNYENSKLKRRERKSRSAHDFGDTNTRSLRVTLSGVTCPTSETTCLIRSMTNRLLKRILMTIFLISRATRFHRAIKMAISSTK
jgi:hypothetical protein